ncbi:phosphinothricin acetyltransferase [Microbacterium ginsengiterrae]|uniref:Phosphinothricin acetyltransferase n=1 Tax=Microbacterium ginsengiterrae TaxID=546115 RepID=A0A7W9CDV5_9MICO|nr:GNAT family N-acetyltransferase [Microbacterium paludicola]MBB5743805.1 phosphinothricin acetyltransferase [Microbacterium ginsengiterrae]
MQFEPGDQRRRLPRHLQAPAPEPDRFAFEIRAARAGDLPDVRGIYNHYVANSVVTFDEKPSTHRYWREKFDLLTRLKLPFLVAVTPTGQVIGYALVQPWASKSAYRYTVENSIYLGPGAGGKGLGTALLQALIAACEQIGLREIVAVISDSGAEASIRLHERNGFVEVGRMGRVGFKFGRSLGTVYLQRSLTPVRRRRRRG